MGDYTALSVTAHIDDERVAMAVREIITDGSDLGLWDDEYGDGRLHIGVEEAPLDAVHTLMDRIPKLRAEGLEVDCDICNATGHANSSITLPCVKCGGDGTVKLPIADFTWYANTSPKYEWLGDVFMHVVGVDDDFFAACDDEGTPVFTSEAIIKMIADANNDIDYIRKATGWYHLDALRPKTVEAEAAGDITGG